MSNLDPLSQISQMASRLQVIRKSKVRPGQNMTVIAAMNQKQVIGAKGGIPWKAPEDMKLFRALTTGHPVVMGRKTWESMGSKPLKERINIVVTFQPEVMNQIDAAGGHPAHSIESAIAMAMDCGGDGYIIGGAQVYKAAMEHPDVTSAILTTVTDDSDGDTFFPSLDGWWQTYNEPLTDKLDVAIWLKS